MANSGIWLAPWTRRLKEQREDASDPERSELAFTTDDRLAGRRNADATTRLCTIGYIGVAPEMRGKDTERFFLYVVRRDC